MSCKHSPEDHIARLSHRPPHALNAMIRINDPAKLSTINRDSTSSSLGSLDILPPELLQHTLRMLDFRSLSHLSRVSLHGNEVVRSLNIYRALMKHAPKVLTALGHTGLITLHSANVIYDALCSEPCVSCLQYGAFLFLPTCQRCCYECLHRNQSLWVVEIRLAKKAFDLTAAQAKQLLTIRSIPGVYGIGRHSRRRQMKLTTVRAAKELGLAIHGSSEILADSLAAKRKQLKIKEYHILRHMQAALLDPPLLDLSWALSEWNMASDHYCGMASILFPSLTPGKGIEGGLWCLGCEQDFVDYRVNKLPPEVIARSPHSSDPFFGFMAMERRAWSTAGFLEHITHCHGAQKLDAKYERKRMIEEDKTIAREEHFV